MAALEEPPKPDEKPASDLEVLAWARRRGLVTFFIFFLILVVFLVIWRVAR